MGKRRDKKHGSKRVDRDGTLPSDDALPAVDALRDIPAFADLPVDDGQRSAFDAFAVAAERPDELRLGCVVRLDRGFPLVVTETGTFRAEHAVAFAKRRGADPETPVLPAVGDRVAVRRDEAHDMGIIEVVLPRRTTFERWRGRAATTTCCSTASRARSCSPPIAGPRPRWCSPRPTAARRAKSPRYSPG